MRDFFPAPAGATTMSLLLNDPHLSDWVAKIETRLQANPHDAEGWFALGRDAMTRPIHQMREFWERAVSHFPTHPYFWMLYIEQEIKARHFEEAEKLFAKCLHKIPSIELNRLHVRYVTQSAYGSNPLLPSHGSSPLLLSPGSNSLLSSPGSNPTVSHGSNLHLPNHSSNPAASREKIREAYDQAVARVGQDVDAAGLYLEYVKFLQDCEAVGGAYAEQQKAMKIREVYQKACSVPLRDRDIEHLWKEYCQFETNYQPQYADKVTADRSREYMNAKKQGKVLEPLVRALRRDKLPSPPRTLEEERHQIDNWRKWLNFERANPLMLDEARLMRRVAYVFENCLMCMPYRLDMWLETAAHYREAADKAIGRSDQVTAREVLDSAASCLERGIVLYPDRPLFYLVIADLEEYRKNHERVKKIFERCLKKMTENPTLAYIHYMLFSRRVEGIKAAREVFRRAREDSRVTQEIYVASALMEFFTTKDKALALRIFELILKKHPPNATFVETYVDFLALQNEQINAKILIEKALVAESLSLQEKLILAGKSLQFDTLYGDYDSIQKTEKSRAELLSQLQLPASTSLIASRLVSRWNYMDLTPLTDNDLKNMDYVESRNAVSLTPPSPFDLFRNSLVQSEKSGSFFEKNGVVLPDLSAMLPFKPRRNNRGFLSVSGGDYVFPEALEELKKHLPPPESFAGPFPDLDQVIRLVLEEEKKTMFQLQKTTDGIDSGVKIVSQFVEMNQMNEIETEKIKTEFQSDKRFATDIYRARQAKKMKSEGE